MQKLLATVIYIFAGLSAAQCASAYRLIYLPVGKLTCGNVISDPFLLLVNFVGPIATACAMILATRCFKSRHWPGYTIVAFFAFVVTLACLAYEAHLLTEYGFDLNGV